MQSKNYIAKNHYINHEKSSIYTCNFYAEYATIFQMKCRETFLFYFLYGVLIMSTLNIGSTKSQNIDSKTSPNIGSIKSRNNSSKNGHNNSPKIGQMPSCIYTIRKSSSDCVLKFKSYFLKKHPLRFGGVKQIFPKNNITGSLV